MYLLWLVTLLFTAADASDQGEAKPGKSYCKGHLGSYWYLFVVV
jgi:hypothetical protein